MTYASWVWMLRDSATPEAWDSSVHKENCYGVVTEKFLGERELVIKPLDPRLGKIKDISSGALLDDGSLPVMIVCPMTRSGGNRKVLELWEPERPGRGKGPISAAFSLVTLCGASLGGTSR